MLQPGGAVRVGVPHFSNPAFYSDLTHRAFFGVYTFSYWVRETPFRRKTPHYEAALPFVLTSARHRFTSSRPFSIRHGLKKIAGSRVGLGRWTKEFYEEHLCWLMPCCEVEFVLIGD